MSRFFVSLWFSWLLRVIICTFVTTLVFSFVITAVLYISSASVVLDKEHFEALSQIFSFWFKVTMNIAFLFALFRSIKYIFQRCYGGYMFELKKCEGAVLGYGDLVGVWRRWFMLLIWLVAAEVIVAFVIMKLFFGNVAFFTWFQTATLYAFTAVAGFFSFILLPLRSKMVKVVQCI